MKDIKKQLAEHPHGMLAGAGEIAQYMVHNKNDNTVRFVLEYPCRLSAQILQEATLTLVNQVDVLHSSFKPGSVEAFWIINKEISAEDCFEVVEAEDRCAETAAEEFQKTMSAQDRAVQLAKEKMLLPVSPKGRAQLFCHLIQGEEKSVLVLRVSHLCADGSDARYLLEKLIEAYRMIVQKGSAETLVVKNGSRSAFQLYKELTVKEYLEVVKPNLSAIKTEFPFPEEGPGIPRVTLDILESELVDKMKVFAKENNATLNDMLLTACYRACGRLPGIKADEPMSIMSMMDVRRHCKGGESDGLCNMSGSLSTELKQGVFGDFSETLSEISAHTRKIKEDPLAGLYGLPLLHTVVRTMPLGVLLKAAEKVYGSFPIGLTNLGNIPYDGLKIKETAPCSGIFGGPLKKKPGMQICAAGFGGSITLCCIGEYGEEDAELVQFMLSAIKEELTSLAE